MVSEEELETFKSKFINHAITCVKRMQHCDSEEATKQSLILPFISLLGYDIFNAQEVVPEHKADFSEKFKNRVDYAIIKDGKPSIAIECKKATSQLEKADRGQLRSYFNACESIKLGVLTNGINYEFFADCDLPNMMDETPFVKFDLNEINNSGINEKQLRAVVCFMKTEFNPEDIGAEAKKKLITASIGSFLEKNFKDPSEEFVQFILRNINAFKIVTKRAVEDSRPLMTNAMGEFIDKQILNRVGLSGKENIIKEDSNKSEIKNDSATNAIVTTEMELQSFYYTIKKLAFLIKDEFLYEKLDRICYQDHKTKFGVYYRTEKGRKGLFTLKELSNKKMEFFFPVINQKIITNDFSEIDDFLLASYKKMANPFDYIENDAINIKVVTKEAAELTVPVVL